MAQVLHTDRGEHLVGLANAHSLDCGDLVVMTDVAGTGRNLMFEVFDNSQHRLDGVLGQHLGLRNSEGSEAKIWTGHNTPWWRVVGGRA